jgi:lipoyl(octanoyl) transferase
VSGERQIDVYRLGRVEYENGLRLQQLFGAARGRGLILDSLLLLEHPAVLTLGRGAKADNVLASPETLERLGIEVFETNRGGDVTYHGPGQVVGYPIFQLDGPRRDVRRYVRDIEEVMIRSCTAFGVAAGRIPEWTGVWVGEKGDPNVAKIGAIGVHLSRWLTSHGFALNVCTDLKHFGLIVPCGIRGAGVTSLEKQVGHPVSRAEVESKIAEACGEVFGASVAFQEPATSTVSVVVTRGADVLLLRRTAARGGFWQPVTGRVEPGETPAQAALRELREETGATADVSALGYSNAFALGDAVPPQLIHETAFSAYWPGGEIRLDRVEHDDFAWLPAPEAVKRLPFAGLRAAVRLASAQSVAR